MENRKLRALIATAIVLLVLERCFRLASDLWGMTAGIVGAGIVAVVSLVCGRMARVGIGHVGWFLVPTILFTVFPALMATWKFMAGTRTFFDLAWGFSPLLLGFVTPLGLLLIIYMELRRRDTQKMDRRQGVIHEEENARHV